MFDDISSSFSDDFSFDNVIYRGNAYQHGGEAGVSANSGSAMTQLINQQTGIKPKLKLI